MRTDTITRVTTGRPATLGTLSVRSHYPSGHLSS